VNAHTNTNVNRYTNSDMGRFWALNRSASLNRVFSLFLYSVLPLPPTKQNLVFSVLSPRPGKASLVSFVPFPRTLCLAFFSRLRSLLIAMLELRAPLTLSSFLEGALYKCSIWITELSFFFLLLILDTHCVARWTPIDQRVQRFSRSFGSLRMRISNNLLTRFLHRWGSALKQQTVALKR